MNKIKSFSVKKLLAVIIASGLLLVSVFGMISGIKKSASAEVIATESEASDSNYFYSAPNPEFLIENAEGTIIVSGNNKYVLFKDKNIQIPNIDFYKILDYNGCVIKYQADVLKNTDTDSPIVFIGIYNENSKSIMYLHYGDVQDELLYNVRIELDNEEFNYFTENAVEVCLGDDDLSQRLKDSNNVYFHGMDKEAYNKTMYATSTATLNSIPSNKYDSYTDTNNIINQYTSTYLGGNLSADKKYKLDDSIIKIIPKELFFIFGEHLYIGKEYGFFVKVTTDYASSGDYAADVLVFDFIHNAPSFPSNTTGSCSIKPVFQYKFRGAIRRSTSDWSLYDPSLNNIVVLHNDYTLCEYYLDNIRFRFTLENPSTLNPGDSGYDPYNDDGAFIIQTRYAAKGVGLKKKKDRSFIADTVTFAFGFIPKVSSLLSTYSYIEGVFNGFGNGGGYCYSREVSVADTEAQIDTYETNNTDQIRVRGQLIKSMPVTVKSNEDAPRIIDINGYATAKYIVARKSGSTNYQIRIKTSIQLSVLEDNTYRKWLFGWKEKGEVINYGSAEGTYLTKIS